MTPADIDRIREKVAQGWTVWEAHDLVADLLAELDRLHDELSRVMAEQMRAKVATSGPVDLDRLDALGDAATPGPWEADGAEIYVEWIRDWIGECCRVDGGGKMLPEGEADAAFIAEARTAVPALVARCRELETLAADAVKTALRHKIDDGDTIERLRSLAVALEAEVAEKAARIEALEGEKTYWSTT